MKLFTAALFSLVISITVNAQKFSTKVMLTVTAPEDIKSEIQSYIGRELRALADVTIVEEKPSWSISIIVVPTITTAGRKLGFAFSTLITQPLHTEYLDKFAVCDEKSKANLRPSFTVAEIIQNFNLQTAGSHELQVICKRIIAEFDSKLLDFDRKAWQRSIESYKP
jgi:hypothetical protein